MRLQVALDCEDINTALKVLEEIYPYVDIAELGTGLMISEGAGAIKTLRKEYPDLTLLSDVKLMDGGGPLAQIVLDAGADIVTVLGAAADNTIRGVAEAAKSYGKESFVDLICVKDVEKRAAEVDQMGVDYIGVHTSYDLREEADAPLDGLKKIKNCIHHAKTSISGGIKCEMLPEIIKAKPDVVITGSSVMNAKDKRKIAKQFYQALHQQQ